MKDRIFVDSNVLLYLLSDDERKKGIAKDILKSYPVISVQVISENINVLLKKFKTITTAQLSEHVNFLLKYCTVCPLTISTIEKAFELKVKYQFQWYDCTILSVAILDNCTILYSEDMQDKQLVDDKLKIVNPFS